MAAVNPSTAKVYATVPRSTAADIPPARAALTSVQAAWADTPVADRCAVLSAVVDHFVHHAAAVAAAVSEATGKPAAAAMDEVVAVAAVARHVAEGAPRWLGADTGRACAIVAGQPTVVRRVPLGVVTILAPYNFPLWLALSTILAALAAGNGVTVEVLEVVPAVGVRIAELFAACTGGRLESRVRVFHGTGDVGAALVDAAVGKPDHVLCVGSVSVEAQGRRRRGGGGDRLHARARRQGRGECVRRRGRAVGGDGGCGGGLLARGAVLRCRRACVCGRRRVRRVGRRHCEARQGKCQERVKACVFVVLLPHCAHCLCSLCLCLVCLVP